MCREEYTQWRTVEFSFSRIRASRALVLRPFLSLVHLCSFIRLLFHRFALYFIPFPLFLLFSLVILVLSVTDKYSFRFFLASGRMRQIKLDLFYDLFCSIIFSFWFSILVGMDRIPNVRYISYILLISNRDILSIYFNKLQHNYYFRIFSNIPLEEIRKLTETFRLSAIR